MRAGPADGVSDFDKPVGSLVNGACEYGLQNRESWPNWRAAAISPSNPLFEGESDASPKDGCGACIEIECTSVSDMTTTLSKAIFLLKKKEGKQKEP